MTEVMRISVGFFRRMLHQTPANEALASLASSWAPRVQSGHVTLGLSAAEHTVHVVTAYVGAVTSGGHPAFFYASPPETAMTVRVAQALATLRLRAVARAFGEACCLWPGQATGPFESVAELDRAMQERARTGWSHRAVEVLDAIVWGAADLDARLLAYLREHEDQVLLPERGRANDPGGGFAHQTD